MKKLLIGVALASTCLATPALARDGAFYFELNGGVMKLQDIEFDVTNLAGTTTVDNAVDIDHDYGYDFGAIIGYDFGAFRVEGEAAYRGADQDDLVSTVGLATNGTTLGPVVGGSRNAGGKSTALSFMLNGLADFGPDDGLQFFAGGGVGYAKVDVESTVSPNGFDYINDDDWGFAWQLLAGVRAPLNESVDVGVKYRFFNVSNVDLVDNFSTGRDFEGRWRSHSLLGTVGFNFGGAERMPDVTPPPPPPPEPVYTPPPPPPPPVYTPPPPPPPMGERG